MDIAATRSRRGEARLALVNAVPTTKLDPVDRLPAIIGGFKSAVTNRINELRGTPGAAVWQRSFHDRVVRDETELNAYRRYIDANPRRWRGHER
jgi:hypothetical protein